MTSWLAGHLVLAGIGVTLLTAAALLAARLCRNEPVACHRHLVMFLPALLLVVPIQIAAPALIDWPSGSDASSIAAERWQAIVGRTQLPSATRIDTIAAQDVADFATGGQTPAGAYSMAPMLTWLYLAGCAALVLQHVRRIVATRRLLAGCEAVHSPSVLGLWRVVARPLCGRARLLQSGEVFAPACCGWWRPMVIMPADASNDAASTALRFALLHEVEHVRRRDWLVAAVQSLVVMLYWFHPLVWLYSRALDQQRELSCDALVVRRTGQARGYALALLDYCERRSRRGSPHARRLLALDSLNSLSRRIHMLTRTTAHARSSARSALVLAASLSCAGLAIATHASLAAAAQDKSTPAEPNAVAMKTLKAEGGVITSVQFDAVTGGRDPMDVIRDSQIHGQGITGGWITMQETLASAPKAAVKDNVLLADTFNLNLPEGSKLKAVLTASRISTEEVEGKTRITIERGKVELLDEQGVKRVSLRTDPADATFTLDASMEADEVAFIATTGAGAKLRLEFDRTAGVPAGEEQPPHGAVRYQLQPADEDDAEARTRLKIQWIYDVERLHAADNDGNAAGGRSPER